MIGVCCTAIATTRRVIFFPLFSAYFRLCGQPFVQAVLAARHLGYGRCCWSALCLGVVAKPARRYCIERCIIKERVVVGDVFSGWDTVTAWGFVNRYEL